MKNRIHLRWFCVLGVILVPLFCYSKTRALDPVKCIIGEAEDQGYLGMLAVAHGMRNRGTLKGVYGCQSPRVIGNAFSKATLAKARQAWNESASDIDLTLGADSWGTDASRKGCKKTVSVNDHTFFICK